MLRLGKAMLEGLAGAAGFGLVAFSAMWLEQRGNGAALSQGIVLRLAACATTLGLALLGIHWLTRRQRAAAAAELRQVRAGRGFESDGGVAWLLLAVPACLVLGVAGGWALHRGEPAMAGASLAMLVLFLGLGWHVVQLVLRPGPMLRMDRYGLTSAQYGRIPWREVVGIELRVVHVRGATLHVLMLGVREPARYLRGAPALVRWLQGRRLRDARVGALPIGLNLLDKDASLVHESALALRQRDPAPFLPGWHARMDACEAEAILEQRELRQERERIVLELQSLGEDAPQLSDGLAGRLAAHQARSDAAMPRLRQAMAAHAHRTRRDARSVRIALVGIAGLVLLAIALRLAG